MLNILILVPTLSCVSLYIMDMLWDHIRLFGLNRISVTETQDIVLYVMYEMINRGLVATRFPFQPDFKALYRFPSKI